VSVRIEGSVSGQVAIGNNILQIGDVHGGVVNVLAPGEKIQPKPRPSPVDLRPRPFPDLLDRDTEIKTATAAFQSAQPVEFHAAAGSGKTSLLRHLAHRPTASTLPDGVVYLSARHQLAKDLLQSLYDAFYETDVPFKPTDAQLKHDLQNKRALILLDDVELAREDVETMLDAAPACAFLLASTERRMWGEGQSLALGGLPPADALTLIERELGRPLTPQERPVAQRLRVHSKGSPLALIQIAAEVREKGLHLTDLKAQKDQSEGMRTTDLLEFPKQQLQLIKYITRQGEVTLEAAAKHLGDTPDNTRQMLEALENKGYLERVEKKGKWVYRMHFAHKSARGLPPGIWNAVEEGAEGIEAPSFANALNALPAPLRQVMAALAALGGAPVHTEHLAALTGLADVIPTLKALQHRGLVQAHSPRYSLTGGLDAALQQVVDLTPWMERAAAYFTAWAETQQQSPERLMEEAEAILEILKWAANAGRWADVLRLGRAIEGALALGGHWAAWAQVLRWILQAGQALGDQATEAWALHQLGTRSLCLGDDTAARASLTQALQLREALGDKAGAAVTRHNLDLLSTAPPTPPEEPPEEPPPKTRPPLPKWFLPTAGVIAVGAVAATVAIAVTFPKIIPTSQSVATERPAVETTEPTTRPTRAPTKTPTRAPTKTPTRTPTKTPTATPTEVPWITIDLVDGCDREYTYRDQSSITVQTNAGGPVKLLLDNETIEGNVLDAGEIWPIDWEFAEMPPDGHVFTAMLMSLEGGPLNTDTCSFTFLPACTDFESLPAGSSYTTGDSFTFSEVTVHVLDGGVVVEDSGDAGTGNELFLSVELVEFTFEETLSGLEFRYSNEPPYDSYVTIEIDDENETLDSMEDFHGHIIGGAQITVQDGVFRLDGTIRSLIIGVNELYIDDFCIW
jgi:hypothetical protein